MSVVKFNKTQVAGKINKAIHKAQEALDAAVLQDSNYFIPHDTGTLEESGTSNTVIGGGKVIWKTPYARYQYYEQLDHSKQRNPNACMKWFEAAKARFIKKWETIANDYFKRNK